ncbi:MAG: heavy metal-binding domain-containing protein [Acidisphaera sp.]|nr:heavy metal-binding domain-containing protein [Acidisphaera sp.]
MSGLPDDHELRVAEIQTALRAGQVPSATRTRLEAARAGRVPWVATLTPAELRAVRSHGLRPIAAITATCWMHYGWSWTEGHAQGWNAALARLKEEAKAAGANAVLDVKMRTIPLTVEHSMDFTLIGTAVRFEELPPSNDPVVATVPALEFVKLLEADVVATGIAIGAQYDFLSDWTGSTSQTFAGNTETSVLSQFWEHLRQRAHAELRRNAAGTGNGVLAHVNFGQLFKIESNGQPKRFLGRQIVVATTVDAPRPRKPANMPWGPPPWGESKARPAIPHEIGMVVDMCAGRTPLAGRPRHHQSYASNEREGAI